MKQFIAIILLAAGAALIAEPGMLAWLSRTDTAPRPTAAVPAPEPALIFAGGVVEGAQREVPLQFEITGRILAIPVVEGEAVAAGQLLAQLDDRLLLEQLVAARQQHQLSLAERERIVNGARQESREVVRAAARLAAVRVEQARADKLRAEHLYARRAMAEDEYDRRRFAYDIAVAEHQRTRTLVAEIEAEAREDEVSIADAKVRLAASAVQQAELMVEKCRLVAPTSGTVIRLGAEPGQLVDPEHMLSVVTMANTDSLRVRAWVEELDALAVDVGQPVTVVPEGRSVASSPGTITWVAPRMGPKQYRHHNPGEMLDVHVREVLVSVTGTRGLIVGHPVEVFINPVLESTGVDTLPPDGFAAGSAGGDTVSIPLPPRPITRIQTEQTDAHSARLEAPVARSLRR